MKDLFLQSVLAILRLVFCLRYRVKIVGLSNIIDRIAKSNRGLLVLPNHPSQIESVILFLHLYPKLKMRPLVGEAIWQQKLLRPFFSL